MDLIIFDVKGVFAHFRKYYTNSSSLTYKAPPRTTIAGLIAGILGYGRDSYYDAFSSDKAKIAVKIEAPSRKLLQTLNFTKATSPTSLITFKEAHTQIPFEVLCNYSGLKFRIYFSHEDEKIMQELRARVKEKKYYFSPYLGIASFNCSVENVDFIKTVENKAETEIDISSLINTDFIEEKSIKLVPGLSLARENMPRDFGKDRYLSGCASYLFDENGKSIGIISKVKTVCVEYINGMTENIMFM